MRDWRHAGLHQPSFFRLFAVTLLQREVRLVGRLSESDWTSVRACSRAVPSASIGRIERPAAQLSQRHEGDPEQPACDVGPVGKRPRVSLEEHRHHTSVDDSGIHRRAGGRVPSLRHSRKIPLPIRLPAPVPRAGPRNRQLEKRPAERPVPRTLARKCCGSGGPDRLCPVIHESRITASGPFFGHRSRSRFP